MCFFNNNLTENHLLEEQQLFLNISGTIGNNSSSLRTNSSLRMTKNKTKKLFNFNSCSQIECEAGGTCVEEDDGSSALKNGSQIPNQTAKLRKMHRKLRCRCPLGRGGFFCEKREL